LQAILKKRRKLCGNSSIKKEEGIVREKTKKETKKERKRE
jgi:hypothetical protein